MSFIGHTEGGMNLTEITSTLAASPTLAAIALAAIVLFFGFRFLSTLNNDSPFSPYAIQIFALIVILPVVLTLALTAKFPTEALTGLLGTIVGFFFGGAHRVPPPARQQRAGGGQGGRGRDAAAAAAAGGEATE
jgi:hypothetical protein